MPVDMVLDLELSTGKPLVTAQLAAASGYRLEPTSAAQHEALLPTLARANQLLSDLIVRAVTAEADGVVTEAEWRPIRSQALDLRGRIDALLAGAGD